MQPVKMQRAKTWTPEVENSMFQNCLSSDLLGF